MKLTMEALKTHGYQRIASEAQAYQLLMREIKVARSRENRYGGHDWFRTNWSRLQDFTVGKWYKFVSMSTQHSGKVLVLAEATDDDQFDEELECSALLECDLPAE